MVRWELSGGPGLFPAEWHFRDVYLLSREEQAIEDVEIRVSCRGVTVSAPDYTVYDAAG